MTTKLVSANMGIVLVVERDGKQEKHEFSVICPALYVDQPFQAVNELLDFLNEQFGTEYLCYDSASEPKHIPVAKPKRIKAPRAVSQKEFNRKIKGLGYETD